MGIWSEQMRKKTRKSSKPQIRRYRSKFANSIDSRSKTKQKQKHNQSIPAKLFWELHRDLPRKVIISVIAILMIYFTSQINQGWSQQVMEFLYRVTTQQPDYTELISEFQDREFLDEIEILPVINDHEKDIFDWKNN